MRMTLQELTALLERRGESQYGMEAVSQLDHALQCANLAQQACERPSTIVACLLHDVGHLIAAERQARSEAAADRDDLHEYIALPFLRGLFPDAVLEPIRLHVQAKRYLCRAEPAYWETLSPASKRSLELQGGIYSPEDAASFIAQPFAEEAVRLRRYDDLAKTAGLAVPGLPHYQRHLAQAAI